MLYDNLPLIRIDIVEERTKRPGFGAAQERSFSGHSTKLNEETRKVLDDYKKRPRPIGITPELLLKIEYTNSISEDDIRRCGLEIVSIEPNKSIILFSSSGELNEFLNRLNEYSKGPQGESKNPAYNNLFSNVENVANITPEDRIGPKLRQKTIDKDTQYWIDIELWRLEDTSVCRKKLAEIKDFIIKAGGRVTDDLIGNSIFLVRAYVSGKVLIKIFELDMVSMVDIPAQPLFNPREIFNLSIDDLPEMQKASETDAKICIIDSGILQGHPYLQYAIGYSQSFPASLGTPMDVNGHGTGVAGIALYGDIAECIKNQYFKPEAVLYSARVTNKHNQFDNEHIIYKQMREAIEYFHGKFGCRIFNISLGDPANPYLGGKQSIWATTLDELARELDIIILISSGNCTYQGSVKEHVLSEYPKYLLDEPTSRIIDPANSALAITVGSICHSEELINNLGLTMHSSVHKRAIGKVGLPSPFTRTGPGINGAIKPDVCEFGGNQAYDGITKRICDDSCLSLLTTNKDYHEKIFTTNIGTSLATPKVANATAKILNNMQGSTPSANLIRSLLVQSADIPKEAQEILCRLSDKTQIHMLYGYGQPNVSRILKSTRNRVTLYAENTLELDKFHMYEIPITKRFQESKGQRKIITSLAFDPPVKHTRIDYLGTTMSFRIIRGKNPEEVIKSFKKKLQENKSREPELQTASENDRLTNTSFECKMMPSPTIRENGSVQKGVFTMTRNPKEEYGDTYYLVVRCESKWSTEIMGPQKYAVVVTLEHQNDNVDLYQEINTRIQPYLREHIRVKKIKVKI